MGIELYCGVNETKWNHHPVAPGNLACIAPVYGKTAKTQRTNCIKIPSDTIVIQDSGAFSDNLAERLSFSGALDRQNEHAEKYGYADQISHIASYDLLIDEKWIGGARKKARWALNEAEFAIAETINAAKFIANRYSNTGLILSAQGINADQYARCVKQIIPLLDEKDMLGLGGWCIIGKMPRQMMPVFRRVICAIVPMAAKNGVKQLHIWGVIYPHALGELLWMCNQHNLKLSTDSAGPSLRPAAFGEWGYGDWKDSSYIKAPVKTRGLDRARHVQLVRDWLSDFENTQYYREPIVQLTLWGNT